MPTMVLGSLVDDNYCYYKPEAEDVLDHSETSLPEFVTSMEAKLKAFTEHCWKQAKKNPMEFPLFREANSSDHDSWEEAFNNFIPPNGK